MVDMEYAYCKLYTIYESQPRSRARPVRHIYELWYEGWCVGLL